MLSAYWSSLDSVRFRFPPLGSSNRIVYFPRETIKSTSPVQCILEVRENPVGTFVPRLYNIRILVAITVEIPPTLESSRAGVQATATAFVVLFCIVGLALWGLPFYYDFMVQQFGWSRAQVTSGNALSKLLIGPAFGFVAGWMIDRFSSGRIMMAGILIAGIALVGLGSISTLGMFYFFYMLNALGYVLGGPLPNQVLLSRSFDKSRGKAMGFAYLGIGFGGAAVPWISHTLVLHFGWQAALRILGLLIVVIAFPMAFFVKEPAQPAILRGGASTPAEWSGLSNPSILAADRGQYVLDRSGQRNAAEFEIVLKSRSALFASCGHPHSFPRVDLQHRRSFADGLARRPIS